MSVRVNFVDTYLQGMREKYEKQNGIGAGEQGKLVFVVSTEPSLAQFISLFTMGKEIVFRSSKFQINSSFSL